MAIDAVNFGPVKIENMAPAVERGIALAEHVRKHYDMVQSVDIVTNIDGPSTLGWVARHGSLADWETAMAQFSTDEEGQALYASLLEVASEGQWHFYRIEG